MFVPRQELPDAEQVVDAALPDGDGHVRGHGPGDVKLRGDEHDEHLDLLRRALGHLGEVDERLHVFVAIRPLLPARRDNLLELLLNHLVRDLVLGALHDVELLHGLGGAALALLGGGLATLANRFESVVVAGVLGLASAGALRRPSRRPTRRTFPRRWTPSSPWPRRRRRPWRHRPSGACGASA